MLAVFGAGAASPRAVAAPKVVHTVAEARGLGSADLAAGTPAQIEAVVVYYEPSSFLTFIHDPTGGMYVASAPSGLQVGDRVQIDGVVKKGRVAPLLDGRAGAPKVRVIGHGPLPQGMPVKPEVLPNLGWDAQWVALACKVRSVSRVNDRAALTVEAQGETIQALIPGYTEDRDLPSYLKGLPVTVTGVLGTLPTNSLTLNTLYVPTLRQAEIDPDFLRSAFASPHSPTSETYGERTADAPRLHFAGAVTLVRPGLGFFMVVREDGHWATNLWVRTSEPLALEVGQYVEVLGFPERSAGQRQLRDALVQPGALGFTQGPERMPSHVPDVGVYHGKLVSVAGELLEQQRGLTEDSLLVEIGGERIACARLPVIGGRRLPEMAKGSRLQLVGVCVVNAPRAAEPQPFSYQLWMRSAADVALLAPPPWWTPGRILTALAVTVGAAVVALAWAVTLRRRVEKQTRTIRQQLAREAIYEERTRIAREFHDTFEQHLSGLNMQLDAVSARSAGAPPEVHALLATAREMARHSRDEARHAIWELRSPALAGDDFLSALETKLRPLAEQARLALSIEAPGGAPNLPLRLQHHLLRVAQEALTNIVKHAGARSVAVKVWEAEGMVRLSVRDDGKGFDPGGVDEACHFGLCGMRERAARLDGWLRVESSPGAGAEITVAAPASGPAEEAAHLL